ncbi:MAG TPA: protein kinase [Candidatus Eremiobacteraeota bacterium]|nr:protein kinase [Candidatus Eremiobacteraeota bacterium]
MLFCEKCGHNNSDEACFCQKCGEKIIVRTQSGFIGKGVILDGRYEIKRMIKAGGMGAVYEAIDRRFLDKPCAIKEMLSDYTNPADQQYMIKSFKKEAELLHDLRHPNMPIVKDYFIEHSRYYLVMDYIEGKDLETIIQGYFPVGVPIDKVIHWSLQILDALDYLHSQSPPIVYRDLKPGNIMLRNSDEKLMLIDFGIARRVFPGSQTTKTSVGTPVFAAEELFYGKPEPRSDIYSLGATMHCLLAGETPLVPFSFKHLRSINPEIPEELEEIVMKALGKTPQERFRNAREMKKALEALSFTGQLKLIEITDETINRLKTTLSTEQISSLEALIHNKFSEENLIIALKNLNFNTEEINNVIKETNIQNNCPLKLENQDVSSNKEGKTKPVAIAPSTVHIITPPSGKKKINLIPILAGFLCILVLVAGIIYFLNNRDYTLLVENAVKNSDYGTAIKYCKKILKKDGNDIKTHKKLLDIYMITELEDYKQISLLLDKLIEIDKENSKDYIQKYIELCNKSLQKKDKEFAKECFEKILHSDPDNLMALKEIAEYYKEKNQYEKAIEYYERILKIKPANTEVNLTLADYYIHNEDYDKASSYYEKAKANIKDKKKEKEIKEKLSVCYLNRAKNCEDPDKAQKLFDKALKLDKNNTEAGKEFVNSCIKQAKTFLKSKKYDLAKGKCEEILNRFSTGEFAKKAKDFLEKIEKQQNSPTYIPANTTIYYNNNPQSYPTQQTHTGNEEENKDGIFR